MKPDSSQYSYQSSNPSHTHAYLWNVALGALQRNSTEGQRVFELGCGNGAFAQALAKAGYQVTGVDPSREGIARAQESDFEVTLEEGSAYDPLSERYGRFSAVTSLEVVEHVYYPRKYAKCVFDLLEPGGVAIISTPYHGYLKNLSLAIAGKMDSHYTALWDHGHIKFWSIATLCSLFEEQGMTCEEVHRVGRIPPLAKSMILIFRKPSV